MNEKKLVKCDYCGELFLPKRSTQHYCRKTIKRKCLICQEEFETNCSPDSTWTCNKPECKKQAGQVQPPREKICKRCGEKFITTRFKQAYCNKEKKKTCPVCGKEFTYICGVDVNATCSPQCQAKFIVQRRQDNISSETRICKWCGKEFHPREVRDVYCYDQHYNTCVICGKQFEFDPRKRKPEESRTCSKECMGKLMSMNHDYEKGMETYRASMLEKYGVTNSMRVKEFVDRVKETNLQKYGSEWYTQTDEYKEQVKQTNIEKYGSEWYLCSPEAMTKRTQTVIDTYGVDNVAKCEEIKDKIKKSMLDKYGVDSAAKCPEIRAKMTRNARNHSKLELRICNLLDNYNINYVYHYSIKRDNLIHEFDFYLPDYKLLVDADGLYYHSYLDDPDGERVRDDYDNVRLALVPDDHRFYLIVEGQEDKQIKDLVNELEIIKGNLSKLDSKVFEWCRSIDFPYPKYTEDRMKKDFNHLTTYTNDKYVSQCRLGQSIIKNFHRSIYHCRVGESVSPFDGWYDDNKLKQVIRNRFIYKNEVDPSKVLSGFNISKICPCVSTFNPVLAKYLVQKYLSSYGTVFDPFSGFSGRLLGVAATDKKYIGHDLNAKAVEESNSIIDFLGLNREDYSVTIADILETSGQYECLLTCPPYYKKEIYSNEVAFKICDDWIKECLNRFKCKTYVFVVDETSSFKDNIVEELKVDSHLNNVTEYVIVIQRDE